MDVRMLVILMMVEGVLWLRLRAYSPLSSARKTAIRSQTQRG